MADTSKYDELEMQEYQEILSPNYTIISEVGSGTFGLVYQGYDCHSRERVAIKVCKLRSFSKLSIEVIANEPEMLRQMNHSNIVKFYEKIEHNGTIFQVMEALEGGDLKDFLTQRKLKKGINEEEAKEIMQQILRALKYMHVQKEIMHRDQKPENILLKKSNNDKIVVKLCDFGQAAHNYKNEQKAKQSITVGTKCYMAPEMFFDKEYNHKVDMWSAGCILYNLLSNGKHPFYKYGDDHDTLMGNLRKMDLNVDNLTNVSDHAKDLMKRLLEKNPSHRYSAGESLNHPWITGADLNERPFTPQELMEMYMINLQLKQVCRMALFTNFVKTKYKETCEKKTHISRLNWINDFKKETSLKVDCSPISSQNSHNRFLYNNASAQPNLDVDSLYSKNKSNKTQDSPLLNTDANKCRPSILANSMHVSPNKTKSFRPDSKNSFKSYQSTSSLNLSEQSMKLKGNRSTKNFYSILNSKKKPMSTTKNNSKQNKFSSFYVDSSKVNDKNKARNCEDSRDNVQKDSKNNSKFEVNDMFNKTYNEIQYLDKDNFKERTINNLERKRMYGSMAVFSKPPALPNINNSSQFANPPNKQVSGRNSVNSSQMNEIYNSNKGSDEKEKSQFHKSDTNSKKVTYKLNKNEKAIRARTHTNFMFSNEAIKDKTKADHNLLPLLESQIIPKCQTSPQKKQASPQKKQGFQEERISLRDSKKQSYSRKIIFFNDGTIKPADNFSKPQIKNQIQSSMPNQAQNQSLNNAHIQASSKNMSIKKASIKSTPKLIPQNVTPIDPPSSSGSSNRMINKQMSKSMGRIKIEMNDHEFPMDKRDIQATSKSKFNEALLNNKRNNNFRLVKGPTDGTLIQRIDKNKKQFANRPNNFY